MRFLLQNRSQSMKPAVFLAIVASILLTIPAFSQTKPDGKTQSSPVNLVNGKDTIDVVGQGWKLHYGSLGQLIVYKPVGNRLVIAENGTAWFAHGGWLRLIDVKKGIVMGRWHFTDLITNLEAKGDSVEVEYRLEGEKPTSAPRKVTISPQNKKSDFVNPNNFIYARFPLTEAGRAGEFGFFDAPLDATKKVERARKLLPEYEEIARRDPMSPFIQAAYGSFLKDVGDPRAQSVLRAATTVESTDFTELLSLSVYLDSIGEPALAKDAFERGYRDYLERGNDPRMFYVLIGRLVVYRIPGKGTEISPALRKDMMERLYRLGPYMESANLGWTLYARELQAKGDAAAPLWKVRAEDSTRNEVVTWPMRRIDGTILLCFGGLIAGMLFLAVQSARYQPQRKADALSGAGKGFIDRFVRGYTYWSRPERFALAFIVVVSWFSLGLMTVYSTGTIRLLSVPVNAWMGSLASPQAQQSLEKLPENSARNFMVALSHQQAGDSEAALRIYLGQPQYAQAWNNLGVIYRAKGDEAKAREAFEKALQVDSELNEAKLNLGQPTTDLWTSQYHNYFPGKAMLAPPTGEQIREAYLGTSGYGIYLRAAAGPFLDRPFEQAGINEPLGPLVILWVLGGILVFVLFIVLILPYNQATEAPPHWLRWLEMLVVGSSKSWGWLSGIVLASWGALLMALLFVFSVGSPMLFMTMAMPDLGRLYNVLTTPQELMSLQLGYCAYLWILPAAFFLINLVFVARSRKAGAR